MSLTENSTKLSDCRTIKARKAFIKAKLASDEEWCLRGLLAIYRNQTTEEQCSKCTVEDNGIGFSGIDAPIMSDFAKRLIAWQEEEIHQYPTPFSTKQMALCYKIMPKYAGQLERLSRPQLIKEAA